MTIPVPNVGPQRYPALDQLPGKPDKRMSLKLNKQTKQELLTIQALMPNMTLSQVGQTVLKVGIIQFMTAYIANPTPNDDKP